MRNYFNHENNMNCLVRPYLKFKDKYKIKIYKKTHMNRLKLEISVRFSLELSLPISSMVL